MINIKWLVENAGFEDICFVCGEENKENEILGIHIIDNPDTFRFFKKGELVITTGYVFQQIEDVDIFEIIKAMYEHQCSGFVLKINRYFDRVPPVIINEAKKYGIPVLALPYRYALSEVQTCVLREIFASEVNSQNKKMDLFTELWEKTLAEEGIDSVCALISDYLQSGLAFFTKEGEMIAGEKDGSHFAFKDMLELRMLQNKFDQGEHICTVSRTEEEGQKQWMIWKIESRGEILGYFVVQEADERINAQYLSDIEHIIPLISMVLLRMTIKKSVSLRGDIFSYLLDENTDPDVLKYACHKFHFDMNHKWCMIVYNRAEEKHKLSILEAVCRESDVYLYAGQKDDYVLGAVGFDKGMNDMEILELSKQIASTAAFRMERYSTNQRVEYGIGEIVDFDGIKKSYDKAVRSIIFNGVLGGHEMLCYQEQKVYHFLYENVGRKSLEEFCSSVVAVLENVDGGKNMELLNTLQTLVMNGWNVKASAETLYIHRNTLLFRREKIFELLNLMDLPCNRTYLEMVIYAYKVVKNVYDSANAQ